MVAYINIHTHIFNLKCVPNRFFGFPIARILSKRMVSLRISKFLKLLVPSRRDILDRYANMLLIGSKKNQDQIFENLAGSYSHLNMRFVVHSLDMDMMGAGKVVNNYETQLSHLFEVKKKYLNKLLPFLSIDPRKNYSGSLKSYLKEKFERYGFVGIKLYPALGFYPFNPELNPLYEFAEKNKIPITVHCTKGGIYYQGKLEQEHLKPLNLESEYSNNHNYVDQADVNVRIFKNRFTNPANFEEVLSKYPSLKICFAHFGGSDEIKKSKHGNSSNNFYLKIKGLLSNPSYQNLYTDISYTISDKKEIIDIILNDIKNKAFENKILFGTDYYMTVRVKNENKLFDDFIKVIDAHDFKKIAVDNCHAFLQSNFYTP